MVGALSKEGHPSIWLADLYLWFYEYDAIVLLQTPAGLKRGMKVLVHFSKENPLHINYERLIFSVVPILGGGGCLLFHFKF